MNILCIGDIVGRPGRDAVKALLPGLKKEFDLHLVIANAENAAAGSGVTVRTANELFDSGCDVLTLGDHVWDRREIYDYLDNRERVLRPANYPEDTTPGQGFCIVENSLGEKVAIINLLGHTFMRYNVSCAFRTLDRIAQDVKNQTSAIIIDIHAEATSEKVALGHFIDGKASLVFGTHTHVQTADEKILPQGTAYITDLGMTGPHDSVIGQNKHNVIKRFLTKMPLKFEVASDDVCLNGIVVTIDAKTGQAKKVTRIQRRLS